MIARLMTEQPMMGRLALVLEHLMVLLELALELEHLMTKQPMMTLAWLGQWLA